MQKYFLKLQLVVKLKRLCYLHLSAASLQCIQLIVDHSHSFSQMKIIKTQLRSRLGEANLSHLMKIIIESPETLSDEQLQQIVDVWNRKPRRIAL